MQTAQNESTPNLHPEAIRGIVLFNEKSFFDAHEALENAWRSEHGDIRELYQAILQTAVTYLHIQNGNFTGAIKVAARAIEKLERWPSHCRNVDVVNLRNDLTHVVESLTHLGPDRIQSFNQDLFKPIKISQENGHASIEMIGSDLTSSVG